ncbi:MAG TPA: hypothetical protein QGG70_02165 [Candidatus Pacearchaeota archaeon]|nr:hypothetical protein [Candidatus Pacearchaeota archaeon]
MDENREDIEENNSEKIESNLEDNKSNEIENTEKLNDGSEDKKEQDIEGPSGEQDSLFIEKKDDSPQDNKDIEAMQNKQLKWAVFLMVGIILIIVVVPFINTNFINKFDYHGLTFQKTQLGQIEFYSTKFPVVTGTGQVTGEYAVNLRNDPRELADIPLEVDDDKIVFNVIKENFKDVYAPTYITINPFMEACDDSGIALLTLSGFIRDSGPKVHSAVTDKAYAKDNNLTQKWCYGLNTVFVITDGEETKISQIQPYCYKLEFKDCEILEVSEKAVLNFLEQYADRFQVQ